MCIQVNEKLLGIEDINLERLIALRYMYTIGIYTIGVFEQALTRWVKEGSVFILIRVGRAPPK